MVPCGWRWIFLKNLRKWTGSMVFEIRSSISKTSIPMTWIVLRSLMWFLQSSRIM
jgi:Predicted metal-dependent hydrolase with the TIM-barrel fold